MLVLVKLIVFLSGVLFLNFWGCAAPGLRELLLPWEPPPFVEREIVDSLTDDGERGSLELALERSRACLARMMSQGKSFSQPGNSFNRFFKPETIHNEVS